MNRTTLIASLTISVAHAMPAMCQNAADLEARLSSVVKITLPGARQGSGIVIDVSNDVIRVITASHVVEPSGQRAGARPLDRRPCDALPTVRFRSQPDHPVTASSATCTDNLDFAVLEVPRPTGLQALTPFDAPTSNDSSVRSSVVFLGAPADIWERSSDIVVAWNLAEQNQQSPSEPPPVCIGTQSQSGRIEGGYSGGAVVGAELGLVGMVVQSTGAQSFLLCWSAIEDVLQRWQIPQSQISHTQRTSDTSGVRFVGPQVGSLREAARNAVRTYRKALVERDRTALNAVYKNVSRSSVDALFGDATTITLDLYQCKDEAGAESSQVSCAYKMDVSRRTGGAKPDHYESGDPDATGTVPHPMIFNLRRDSFGWQITRVHEPAPTTGKKQ